jgi:hypothetical protein
MHELWMKEASGIIVTVIFISTANNIKKYLTETYGIYFSILTGTVQELPTRMEFFIPYEKNGLLPLCRSSLCRRPLSRNFFCLCHIAEDHIAGDHIAEDHIAGDHIAEDHIAGDHIAEDHIAGDHLAEDHTFFSF